MAERRSDSSTLDRSYADPFAWEAAQDESINLVRVFDALRRGKRTILLFTLAFTVLAAAISLLLPLQYTSTVSFIPPNLTSSNSITASIAGQLSALGAGDLMSGKGAGDLYAGILKSRSIAEILVKRFDLIRVYKVKKESQAEKVLDSNTQVVPDAKSGIVTVSVKGGTPQLAHDIAAGYMSALSDTNGRLALSQASQRRLFFEEQLEQEKDALEDAEVELKKTEEQTGLIAPTGQTESEIRTIADTQAQIAVRRVELAALRQSATEQNPEVIRLQSEIGDLENQMAALQKGNGGGGGATIPTSKVPQAQLDYVRKEREVKYHEALFDALSKQYEAARLDEARDAPLMQVLDAASWPDSKSAPRRTLIVLGGMAAGFLIGCIWALVRESTLSFVAALRAAESSTSRSAKAE